MAKLLATLGREVLDAREEYETKRKAKVEAEESKEQLERELFDRLKSDSQKSSGVLELGPGYGDVSFTRMETVRARVIDKEAIKRALEAQYKEDGYLEVVPRKGPLNELVREALENGEGLPDGVDFTRTPFIRVTRKGGKK